jgi:death-on-curing protein
MDAATLAALYAWSINRQSGSIAGSLRCTWIVARLYLAENGYSRRFDRAEEARIMKMVAAGRIGEEQLSAWFRQRIARCAD